MSYSATGVGNANGAVPQSRDNIITWYAMQYGWQGEDSIHGASSASHGVKVTARMELTALFKGIKTVDVSNEEKLVIFRHLLDVNSDETLDASALVGHLIEAYGSLGKAIQGTIERKLSEFLYGEVTEYGSTTNIQEYFLLPYFKQVIDDTIQMHPVRGEMQCSPVKEGVYAVTRTVDASPDNTPVKQPPGRASRYQTAQAGGSGAYTRLPGGPSPTPPHQQSLNRASDQGPKTPLIQDEERKKSWCKRLFCWCSD